MTFLIILGAAAGVYLLWLMFRIAALALPAYAGIAVALLLHDAGYGYAAVIAAGLAVGGATWLVGQSLFAAARSPLARLGIGALFAVPAGFAGYQLARGVAQMAGAEGAILTGISLAATIATSSAAWAVLTASTSSSPPKPQLAEN